MNVERSSSDAAGMLGVRSPESTAARLAWAEVRKVYIHHGALTDSQFDSLVDCAVQIHELGVAGPNWAITHLILSVHRTIPLVIHYEALSEGYGFGFRGIEAFHIAAIERGVAPAWSLNHTHFFAVPKGEMQIGRLMIALGLVDNSTVDRSVEAQRVIQEKLNVKVALGSIILAMAPLSYPDFYQSLGIQVAIPFKGLNESAPLIFDTLGARLASASKPR